MYNKGVERKVPKMTMYEEEITKLAKELHKRHCKSTDSEKIRKKYGFDKEWTKAFCEKMKELENK